MTVEGDLINRCELFDETDLEAALARFDELNPPAPRLENAATRIYRSRLSDASRPATGTRLADTLAVDISTRTIVDEW